MTPDPQVDEIRHRAQALEKRWMQSLTGEDVRAYLAEEVDEAIVGLLAALEDAQQQNQWARTELQRTIELLTEARAALQTAPICPNHGPMTLVLAQHRCDVCGAFDEVSEVKS